MSEGLKYEVREINGKFYVVETGHVGDPPRTVSGNFSAAYDTHAEAEQEAKRLKNEDC